QLRMRGPRPLGAEVARRLDQSPTEVMLPGAVDDHPRRQWATLVDNRLRQLQSPAPLAKRFWWLGRQDRQEATRHDRTGMGRVAAALHGHVLRDTDLVLQLRLVWAVGQHKQAGILDGGGQRRVEMRCRPREVRYAGRQFAGLPLRFRRD